MPDYKKIADEFLQKAVIAGAIFSQLNQKETDAIVEADRKSVVSGKSVDLGGRRIIKKKTTQ